MIRSPTATRRLTLLAAAVALLAAAFLRISTASSGQAAVSLSLAGQEDLSFWVNRNGLIEIDFEGEIGFGDMARLLMRRRANRDWFRSIRDRFVFRVQELAALETPDLFRVAVENHGLRWLHRPERILAGAGRITNLPVVVINRSGRTEAVDASIGASRAGAEISPGKAAGLLLKIREEKPGAARQLLRVSAVG